MDTIEQILSKFPLETAETYRGLASDVDEFVVHDDFLSAYNLAIGLSLGLSKFDRSAAKPELAAGYQRLLVRCQWLALSLLSSEDVVELFQQHLGEAVVAGIGYVQKLRAALLNRELYEERDELKKSIRTALSQNVEKLQLNPSESLPLSVADLIKDYQLSIGSAGIDAVRREQYLAQAQPLKALSASARGQVRTLLNLYEQCSLSSRTLEGLEEEIPIDGKKSGTVQRGQFQPFDDHDAFSAISKAHTLLTYSLPTTAIPVAPPGPVQATPPTSVSGVQASTPLPLAASAVRVPTVTPPLTVPVPPVVPKVAPPLSAKPPEPTVFKQAGPAFMIDAEDEREVDRFRERVAGSREQGTLEERLRNLAEGAIKHYGFSFKDEGNRRRFINLFVSFFKDVRSVVEAREALARPVEAGGLGLPNDKVEQVIVILDQVKKDYAKQAPPAPAPATKPAKPLDKLMQSDISQFLVNPNAPSPTRPSPAPAKSAAPVASVKPVVSMPPSPSAVPAQPKVSIMPPPAPPAAPAPVPPAAPTPKLPGEFSPEKVQEWRQEMLKEIARVAPPVTVVRTAASAATPAPAAPVGPALESKPRFVDVQAAPRTVGPLGELKSLSLKDFRRLGPTPQALEKVKARVELIGERSVTKRLEAVRAWQASPVYQAYLTLGRTSIERNSPVADTVIALEAEGEEPLSESEFNAIADFNAKLRF